MTALAVPIANIIICILWAGDMAFVTGVPISAHTPGLLRLGVHEAGPLARAHLTLPHPWARHATVLAKKTLLAFTHCLALTALLYAAAPFDTTTDPSQRIPGALHRTVATTVALATLTFATLGPRGNALSLTRADATFTILRTGHSTFTAEVAFRALAESHFLHLVVKTRPMTTANFVVA